MTETERLPRSESVRITEISRDATVPSEVKTWMRRVEENTTAQVNDQGGQAILTPTTPVNPKVTLPVSRKVFVSGFKKSMGDAGKWLSAFILRLIKIKKGEVTFKTE